MGYKFLIYISYSYAIPIGNPLEQEILKRGYEIKWFSDVDNKNPELNNKKNVLKNIREVINYEPDIVLAATDDVPDFISGIKVQIFHGFLSFKRPEKNNVEAHFRIRGFFDLYCTQGPSTTNGFKLQQAKHPHFDIVETGWSKVDPLFPLKAKDKTKKPTIFIASTFTKRLSLAYNDAVFNEIKTLSKQGNYNFSMVMHPKLPEELKTKWQSLNSENFTFFDTTNLIPLFKQSDIMFADTTSAIQEFLLQKKPVVTFNHTFNHNYIVNITETSAIESAFEKALTYPSDLIENIDAFVNNLHPYFDGKSSERVIRATIDFLHKNKNHLKKKPLNLIRKYKIRKRLNFFTFKSFNKAFTK
ncbi:MAG: CDP-glycerol glycerophosphotransferase family protein [Algibacter sp.]|uniref:CDP-glycerol glycerophosphotransferase family protein n=1 Tax=Algibacter sp. TaxID=1872428 RepID=UPI003296E47B